MVETGENEQKSPADTVDTVSQNEVSGRRPGRGVGRRCCPRAVALLMRAILASSLLHLASGLVRAASDQLPACCTPADRGNALRDLPL